MKWQDAVAILTPMTKQWTPSLLSADDEAAYARMQQAMNRHAGKPTHAIARLAQEEGELPDFSTSKGRRTRSARNLRYLEQQNADCPHALLETMNRAMSGLQCTSFFYHTEDHTADIAKHGMLHSNAQLRASSANMRGMTKESDEGYFGNTDFLFTTPIFHDGSPLSSPGKYSRRVYIPADKCITSELAWLSFRDWADAEEMHPKRDYYTGNLWYDERCSAARQAFTTDFFMGSDIPKAMALKAYEALKTAIVVYKKDDAYEGFDTEMAQKFLTALGTKRFRNAVSNVNNLEQPLEETRFTEAQAHFLDTPGELRDKMVQMAVKGTLETMADRAELKIPRGISLDGCAIPNYPEEGTITHLKGKHDATISFHGLNHTIVQSVPPDPRSYTVPPKSALE